MKLLQRYYWLRRLIELKRYKNLKKFIVKEIANGLREKLFTLQTLNIPLRKQNPSVVHVTSFRGQTSTCLTNSGRSLTLFQLLMSEMPLFNVSYLVSFDQILVLSNAGSRVDEPYHRPSRKILGGGRF